MRPPCLELSDQRFGQFARRGGYDDAVELARFGPAQRTVAAHRGHIGDAEARKAQPRLLIQRFVALDGEHMAAKPRQDRRLIAGAGADFEHIVIASRRASFSVM